MTDVSATDAATTTTRAIQHLAERWIQDGTAAEGTAGRGRERWWRRGRTVPTAGFVCSPAGLWLALAAVVAGAHGGTTAKPRVPPPTPAQETPPPA
ncbi:serine protease, partial [Streptomyces rubiginosohelvolus]